MLHHRSLRSRLLVGSILWTIGLLLLSHVAAVRLIHWYFEGAPRIVMTHRTFLIAGLTLVSLALVSMLAGFWQVRRGVGTLDRLRERLAAVRDGRATRLEGIYPTEVAPLVADLNALLDHREAVVRRALAKAGDLAHGLKTPLAVLGQEAERAAAQGHAELAATLAHELRRMERQIELHLAQARAAGAGARLGARASVREAAEALARTLARLHAERGLELEIEADANLAVRAEREELEEMLGNLLDNACKWAKRRVRVEAARVELAGSPAIEIRVDDDGPGLAPELRIRVLERGVRADETAPGSGLGLAIVGDLAELLGGAIELDAAPSGGLRARLTLPAA